MIGDDIVYFQLYSTSIGLSKDPYNIKNPIYLMWEAYFSAFRENAPPGLKSCEQSGGVYWAWMASERAFVTSAVQGIIIATVFAFLILLFATKNIILATISIFCVAIVIISVVAIMSLNGWEFGVSESISVVIIIGLSVDYVVHLATDFQHSAHKGRSDKIKQAYTEMGVSIMSGTITTFGSGAALFGGKVVTFRKFAVLITSTITISFMMSMLLFGAICHICGPENGYGDLDKCKKKEK
jgi:predicted RND superfamily exporter protein